jgi:hypothetical protein
MLRATSALALLVATLILLLAASSPAEAKYTPTTIRSLATNEVVTVASEDVARLHSTYGSLPGAIPRPIAAPTTFLGPAFQVVDGYWDTLARHYKLPNTDGDVPIYPVATYYPDIRVIQLTSDGQQSWFELDAGRDSLLRRYIVLLDEGITEPTFFDVLRVARDIRGEHVEVKLRVDGQLAVLSADDADRFWPAFLSSRPRPDLFTTDFEGGSGISFARWRNAYWPVHRDQDVRIELTLPEGRSIEYTLFRPERYLVRAREGRSVWPAFDVSDKLLVAIEDLVGPPRINHRVPAEWNERALASDQMLAAPRPMPQLTPDSPAASDSTPSAVAVARTTTLALTLLLLGGGAIAASRRTHRRL